MIPPHQLLAAPADVPTMHAIIMGVVQGLSEFLPISSSGHLQLVPWLFGWEEFTKNAELERTFDVALHIGTFVGAAAYFRKDLVRLAAGGLRALKNRAVAGDEDARQAVMLVIASVPAAVIGGALDTFVSGDLVPEWGIGALLVVFGLVLYAADRLSEERDEADFGVRDALLLGAAQTLAFAPGVSRSGATISMGRFLRFRRADAARLSFLMGLPIIGGAGALKTLKVLAGDGIPAAYRPAFAWGMGASAITGFLAVWALLALIKTRSLTPFVVYRVLAGLAVLGIAASR